jgi:hypothetical protein
LDYYHPEKIVQHGTHQRKPAGVPVCLKSAALPGITGQGRMAFRKPQDYGWASGEIRLDIIESLGILPIGISTPIPFADQQDQ